MREGLEHFMDFARGILEGKGNRCEQLNITKKVENNSDFFEKERLKDGEAE